MKKFTLAAIAALAVSAAPAFAADLPVKAKPMAAPPPPPAWDIAFGGGDHERLQSSAASRSRTTSRRSAPISSRATTSTKDVQLYVGIGGASITFPNRAAAEIDFYGGIRPTFGKLALDFGVWYYWYPGGQCFNSTRRLSARSLRASTGRPVACRQRQRHQGRRELLGSLRQGDATRSPTRSRSALRCLLLADRAEHRRQRRVRRRATPSTRSRRFANGVQFYVSGEVGYWDLGTSDAFYGRRPALSPARHSVHRATPPGTSASA